MSNGYPRDLLGIMLETVLDLKEASGRIEQRLSDGHDLHRETKVKLDDYGKRLTVVEFRLEDEEPKTIARRVLEVFRLLWPFLALSAAIIRMLLSMAGKETIAKQVDWFLSFMAGFKTEG